MVDEIVPRFFGDDLGKTSDGPTFSATPPFLQIFSPPLCFLFFSSSVLVFSSIQRLLSLHLVAVPSYPVTRHTWQGKCVNWCRCYVAEISSTYLSDGAQLFQLTNAARDEQRCQFSKHTGEKT